MAKDKKSFLLYCDLIHTVEHLPLEDRGKVFTWILQYVNDQNPEPLPGLLSAVVEPIKQQLKRDLKKYESICERNRVNGKKGGRPKNPNKPSGFSGNPNKPKKADTDTDTDTEVYSFDEFWIDYDYNVSKRKCQSEWMTLSDEEKNNIANHVKKYVKSTPDKKYRKNPYNYLTEEIYLNELPNEELPKMDKGTMVRANEGIKSSMDWLLKKGYTKEQIKQEYENYQKSIKHSFDDMTPEDLNR